MDEIMTRRLLVAASARVHVVHRLSSLLMFIQAALSHDGQILCNTFKFDRNLIQDNANSKAKRKFMICGLRFMVESNPQISGKYSAIGALKTCNDSAQPIKWFLFLNPSENHKPRTTNYKS
jgi:hypothetical protein